MNERIKELAIEARLIAPEYSDCTHTTLSPQEQKFAELIVKECMLQVKEVVIPITADAIEDKIKEHFGVRK